MWKQACKSGEQQILYPPPGFAGAAHGLIPGQQTINRAEQCAVIAAARVTMQSGHATAKVWSDSAFAIQEHERAVLSEVSTHPDLGDLLQQSSPSCRSLQ